MRADEGVSKGRACDGPGDLAAADRHGLVELEHRHMDRHGPGWQAVTDGVDGAEGWPLYLDRYAALIKRSR
jgi:hypothetical protein